MTTNTQFVADKQSTCPDIACPVLSVNTKTGHVNLEVNDIPGLVQDLTDLDTRVSKNSAAIATTQLAVEHVDEKIEDLENSVLDHIVDLSNPHAVTKSQVGLGNVDNTSDLNKPVSTAVKVKLDIIDASLDQLKAGEQGNTSAIESHTVRIDNPHSVTKSQVGLGNVDNTSDLNKPVSIATRDLIESYQNTLQDHISNVSNPHKVTKSQVGLGNVDNTSDLNKPISLSAKVELDKLDRKDDAILEEVKSISDDVAWAQTDLSIHISSTSNPHKVTKAQVGLGNVDNTSDLNKPLSLAAENAIIGIQRDVKTFKENIEEVVEIHTSSYNNPHKVTKAQVGLGNVDNTSDLNKPLSSVANKEFTSVKLQQERDKGELLQITSTKADKSYVDEKLSSISGGLAGSYLTLALAEADKANIPVNSTVNITNDPDISKNGQYTWDGIKFTKSAFDPLVEAKAYTDRGLLSGIIYPFTPSRRNGSTSEPFQPFLNSILDFEVINPRPSKVYRLEFYMNGYTSATIGYVSTGWGIAEYDEDSYEFSTADHRLFVIDPRNEQELVDITGVNSIELKSANIEGLSFKIKYDGSKFQSYKSFLRSSLPDDPGYSWRLDKSTYKVGVSAIKDLEGSVSDLQTLQSSLTSLSINEAKNYPLKAEERDGIVSVKGLSKAENIFLNIEVLGPKELIDSHYYKIAYLQNGSILSGKARNGIRLEAFPRDTYSTDSKAEIIHTSSDAEANYDRFAGGIQTFEIIPDKSRSLCFKVTINVDELPEYGSPVFPGTLESNPYWSWIVDPSCYSYTLSSTSILNRGKYYPLVQKDRAGTISNPNAQINNFLLDAKIEGPAEEINLYYYRISYFQNGAKLSNKTHNGVRIEKHLRSDYDLTNTYESIHTPQDNPASYDRDLGGVQTFSLRCAKDPRYTVHFTLNVDDLPPSGLQFNASNDSTYPVWSWIIDPQCYTTSVPPEQTVTPEKEPRISGIMTIGASLMNYVNGWVESSTSNLGIKGINKAVGGMTPYYHADLMFRDTLYTPQEFEDADVLVVQYASSKDLDNTEGTFTNYLDYTKTFSLSDTKEQFSAVYTHAQTLDYILKNWRAKCFETKDNPNSKWFGTKFGKPFRVLFVTHWHDGREYYNTPIRSLAKRWGGYVCEFDTNIGFSRDMPMPDGSQVSMMYAMDSQVIDGVTYGWHPSRNQEGKYIQNTMSKLFESTLERLFI